MNYYYLIATLPHLSLDETRRKIDFAETLETIKRNLERDDELLFRYLLYPNDNRNLLNAIFHHHHGVPLTGFLEPAIFDQSTIEEYLHEQYAFPEYMADFLRLYQDRFSELKLREIENELNRGFYHEVAQLDDEFIRNYFAFNRTLRSMVSGFNRGLYKYSAEVEPIEEEGISSQLSQEGAGVSILSKTYPFVEFLRDSLISKDPNRIEQTITDIRWDFVESYGVEFFGRQQVFGYVLKLLMVKRQTWLKDQNGKQHLERLINQIRTSSESIQKQEI